MYLTQIVFPKSLGVKFGAPIHLVEPNILKNTAFRDLVHFPPSPLKKIERFIRRRFYEPFLIVITGVIVFSESYDIALITLNDLFFNYRVAEKFFQAQLVNQKLDICV